MKRVLAILTVLALIAPPAALAFEGQQTQTEREQLQAQRDRERAQREAQQEREREQREAQQERDREQRERERERAQRERERERERRNNSGTTQTDRQTKTLNIGADGELDVSNIAGNILVTRSSGTAAHVEILKRADGPNAIQALTLVQVDVIERGNRAEIRTRYPDRDVLSGRNLRNLNVDVSITIAAPRNARLTIKSISGDISVKDISGPINLESTSGSVRITNVGRVTAKSISGDVEAVDTRIEGPLEAGTISGTVRLARTTVNSVTATTVSGDVAFEEIVSEKVSGQSISGTVTFSGDLSPNGRYELSSHSGTIRVALSGKTGFQVEASSFSGSINTEFPLTLTGQARRGRNLRGTYGNGAAMLDLNAFSGSILITKR